MLRLCHKVNPFEPQVRSRHASPDEVRQAFSENDADLKWLALILTGNKESAEACVVNALALSTNHNQVFEEWLSHWAHRATIRCAIESQRVSIREARTRTCPHGHHSSLSPLVKERIKTEPVTRAVIAMDVIARFALVLRGIEGYSSRESAVLLGINRAEFEAAYCSAIATIEQSMPEFAESLEET
ncbi:MAG TPA: hypothetical protein VD837_00420 [Terriglobales bacterium]|nr:hypothetical protein [Terriglobales bacterium]